MTEKSCQHTSVMWVLTCVLFKQATVERHLLIPVLPQLSQPVLSLSLILSSLQGSFTIHFYVLLQLVLCRGDRHLPVRRLRADGKQIASKQARVSLPLCSKGGRRNKHQETKHPPNKDKSRNQHLDL